MKARGDKSRSVQGESSRKRVQCHFVSNTHWDREWKYSAQRIRHQLVDMMDTLLDIFATEPKFKHFHLDSQTAPLLDYVEVRPEREAVLRRLVSSGKLAVGPWFTLPDEFCVGGESLIRNLLLGHRIARRFGRVSKSGYSPFSWGQISQMPQIYGGFGIKMTMFYRGVNTLVAPRSEFVWQGADGTKILASRLAARPRYNVWYILQRPAYWGKALDALNDFELPWTNGHGLFRLVDEAHAALDYKLAHPQYAYDSNVIPACAVRGLREQDGDWTTRHRLWSAGHDSSCPDTREVRMLSDAAKSLCETADVFHSSMEAFAAGVMAERPKHLPLVKGEMRHTFTKGSTSALLGWIISARTYLKQENFRTERALTSRAEPLAVFASMLGAKFPEAFLSLAYRCLLENHAHDSIGGCGRDVVHDDMMYRWRQAREISTCVTEQAMRDIVGAIDLRDWKPDDIAVVVYNPSPWSRAEIISVTLDVPSDWPIGAFNICNEDGSPIATQHTEVVARHQQMAHMPNDVFNVVTANRHRLSLFVPSVPGMGYLTLRLRRQRPSKSATGTIGRDSDILENAFLKIKVNRNGTLNVYDKLTRRRFTELGYFQDSGAAGNPWQHQPPQRDRVYTTRRARAEIGTICNGPLEASLRVTIPWRLPVALTETRRARSKKLQEFRISNTITLRRDQRWVEIVTEIDNGIKDHYLRVSFPTRVQAQSIDVQSQFDVVTRDIAPPDVKQFDEAPQPEQPMNSFVDVSDRRGGLALLNSGLKAYEAHDDANRTIILTLLRGLQMRFFVPEQADQPGQAEGTQCQGRHVFRYAIMPHAGNWEDGAVWQAAESFNNAMLAAQVSFTPHGIQPRCRSFLDVEPDGLQVSAVKHSEDGAGWIVRLFNPYSRSIRGRLRLNDGYAESIDTRSPTQRVVDSGVLPKPTRRRWRSVQEVSLEECLQRTLRMQRDGWVRINVRAKQIATYRFVR
jgi:mannosylglycerate hydrolase